MRRSFRDGWQELQGLWRTVRDHWQAGLVVALVTAPAAAGAAVGWGKLLSALDLVAGVLALLLVLKAAEILLVFGSRFVR